MEQFKIYSENGEFPFRTSIDLVKLVSDTETRFVSAGKVYATKAVDGVKNDSHRRTRFHGISNCGKKLIADLNSTPAYKIVYTEVVTNKMKNFQIFLDEDATDETEKNICEGFIVYCNNNLGKIVGKDLLTVFNDYITLINISRGSRELPAYMLLERGKAEIL